MRGRMGGMSSRAGNKIRKSYWTIARVTGFVLYSPALAFASVGMYTLALWSFPSFGQLAPHPSNSIQIYGLLALLGYSVIATLHFTILVVWEGIRFKTFRFCVGDLLIIITLIAVALGVMSVALHE
jgi:hypothetical protein